VVNYVRKSTEDGGKVLTLVKESCNSPEFESLILCQKMQIPIWVSAFFICSGDGFESSKSQYAGGILLPPVQTLVATLVAVHSKDGNANEPLIPHLQSPATVLS